jgi:hypothetical protein
MTAQFDRKRVDRFVSRVKNAFQGNDVDLVKFWIYITYNITDDAGVPLAARLTPEDESGDAPLRDTWFGMSLWEKQAVLFGMVPLIERCAAVAAEAVAQRARKEEPL